MYSAGQVMQERIVRINQLKIFFTFELPYKDITLPYDIVILLVNHCIVEDDWFEIYRLYRATQSVFYKDLCLKLWKDLAHYWPCYSVQEVLMEVENSNEFTPIQSLNYSNIIRCFIPKPDQGKFYFARELIEKLFKLRKNHQLYYKRNHEFHEGTEKSNLETYQDYRDRWIAILRNDHNTIKTLFKMCKELIQIKQNCWSYDIRKKNWSANRKLWGTNHEIENWESYLQGKFIYNCLSCSPNLTKYVKQI